MVIPLTDLGIIGVFGCADTGIWNGANGESLLSESVEMQSTRPEEFGGKGIASNLSLHAVAEAPPRSEPRAGGPNPLTLTNENKDFVVFSAMKLR